MVFSSRAEEQTAQQYGVDTCLAYATHDQNNEIYQTV